MKCKDCAYAEWERTGTGRIKKGRPGRCNAEVPQLPTMLCLHKTVVIQKLSIWPDYEGQCDLFEETAMRPENVYEREGAKAYQAGEMMVCNPYAKKGPPGAADSWAAGYRKASTQDTRSNG